MSSKSRNDMLEVGQAFASGNFSPLEIVIGVLEPSCKNPGRTVERSLESDDSGVVRISHEATNRVLFLAPMH
jgi:hypothetical protein